MDKEVKIVIGLVAVFLALNAIFAAIKNNREDDKFTALCKQHDMVYEAPICVDSSGKRFRIELKNVLVPEDDR